MASVQQLSCPNCGSPIQQFNPTSQTVICPACNSYVAVGTGDPSVLGTGTKLRQPPKPIKLGQQATIENIRCMVLGRVYYEGWDDEDRWQWTEWLLGAEDGRMFWLSYDEEDGFVFFKKLRFKAAFDPEKDYRIPLGENEHAPIRERYPARILGAEGELTWQATAGDMLKMVEAAHGGKRYSMQINSEELELHEGTVLDDATIANAFGDEKWAKQAVATQKRSGLYFFAGAAALVFACVGLTLGAAFWNSGNKVTEQTVTLNASTPSAIIPVEISNIRRPVMIDVKATGNLPLNTYAEIDVGVIDPEDVETHFLTHEFWHESGSDDEGYWEEDDYSGTGKFVPTTAGQHEIEVEVSELGGVSSVTVNVVVYRNHVMPEWLFGYGVVAGILGIVFISMSAAKTTGNAMSSIMALMDDDD